VEEEVSVPVKVNGYVLTVEKTYQMSLFLERLGWRKSTAKAP
jgi:hypothetical protein